MLSCELRQASKAECVIGVLHWIVCSPKHDSKDPVIKIDFSDTR